MSSTTVPESLWGLPLKHISLVTLTLQNSLLTILLHYSRIRVSPDKMYSAAAAVLLNELIKMSISIAVSLYNSLQAGPSTARPPSPYDEKDKLRRAVVKLFGDVLSSDCWKLSIPACLYVVQNNLQFVAASNLDVPTFQVTYNLKILTTALCSVVMLRKRLDARKWLSLVLLAIGVALVQLPASGDKAATSSHSGGAEMNRLKGFLAVMSACITSGLAGVYFEMVLKGSKTDLWVRNVQLSIFSIMPALGAVFLPEFRLFGSSSSYTPPPTSREPLFANFGFWAWAVVLTQTLGGLVTALVIKYSDNIVKGFATSLAILVSSFAGFILFDFKITPSFLIGAGIVVSATYMYNSAGASPAGYTAVPATPGSPHFGTVHQSGDAYLRRSPPLGGANGHLPDLEKVPALDHRLEIQTGEHQLSASFEGSESRKRVQSFPFTP